MRSYDLVASALALQVPVKWLDNLLSHHQVEGVRSVRQGVRRRISPEAVTTVAVALELIRSLGVPAGRALTIAADIMAAGGDHHATSSLALRIDVASVKRDLADRLADAAEAAPPRRRGRPPGSGRKR